MATDRCRSHVFSLAEWLIAEAELIDYVRVRPMRNLVYETDLAAKLARGEHVTMDCSEMVTMLFKMAGLKDPTGNDYSGLGNTDSMLKALPHYTQPSHAHIGALVVFQNPAHVSMVIDGGVDPVLFSHGSNAGPRRVQLSVERTWHSGTVTFLDIGSR